jgi:hypothetical protein
MKIAFIGIVKDGADYIQRNIEIIKQLNQDIYIVENNSVDGTKEILQRLKDRNTVKSVTTLDLDNKDAMDFCDFNINPLCKNRVRRLAYIRQQGLNSVLRSGIKYDYICVVDLDFVYMDIDGFNRLLSHMEANRDIDGIFGISKTKYNLPYDYGAITPQYKIIPIVLKLNRYIDVTSSFSGVGLYRTSSIIKSDAKYDYEHIHNIEHIHFNSYFDRLVVDTHFNPVYEITFTNNIRLFIIISVVCILLYTYYRLRPIRASYS